MGSKLIVTGYVFGAILAVIGILGAVFGNDLIHYMITSSLKLTPGNDLYTSWLNPPVEVHMNMYLFNLKNGPDFEKNGAKPIFEEIGPFVYKELITKEEIVDNLNYTITYKERRTYHFLPELSPYEESYPITTINMAPIAVIAQIRFTTGIVHRLVNAALTGTGETLLVTKPASEILFGYKDNFLAFLKTLDKKLVPTEYVGLFYGKNDTIDGLYTMYTGLDDWHKLGVIEKFNYQSPLTVWSSQYANMINGTDGTIAPPFLNESSVFYLFESDLCRSLYANFNRSSTVLDDITVLGFSPNEYFFANHTVNPDNEGFCTPAGNCLPAGVLNLTNCVGGIPIIMSCPHFLYGDPKFCKDVDGIAPDYEKHQTMVYIEPLTGIIMKANKRIQFNTQLIKDERITITKNLPEILYPLFWVDENFSIDKPNADKFSNQVRTPLTIIRVGRYVLLGIGAGLVLLTGFIHIRRIVKNKRERENTNYSSINNLMADESSPLLND